MTRTQIKNYGKGLPNDKDTSIKRTQTEDRYDGETCVASPAEIRETERWWDVRSSSCCNYRDGSMVRCA